MKPVLVLVLILGLSTALAADQRIVPGQRVGPCVLGGDPDVLVPEWGPPRKRVVESKEPPRTMPDVYYEYPERGLWLLVRDYRIARIGIEGENWKTPGGLRVGVPVKLVYPVFGKGKVRNVEESDPKLKGYRYYLEYPSHGLTLLVQTKTQIVMAIHVYPAKR